MDETVKANQLVMKRKAEVLARPKEADAFMDERLVLLLFSLMSSRYAVLLDRVQAVTKISEIVTIPLTPKHISGIIRRRGESIALVNLEYFFDSRQTGIADSDYAIIVEGGSKRFALQVADVLGVAVVALNDLVPPQDNFDPAQVAYVSSVTRNGTIVLDLDALVAARGFAADKAGG